MTAVFLVASYLRISIYTSLKETNQQTRDAGDSVKPRARALQSAGLVLTSRA